jgi:hypothetical protein
MSWDKLKLKRRQLQATTRKEGRRKASTKEKGN